MLKRSTVRGRSYGLFLRPPRRAQNRPMRDQPTSPAWRPPAVVIRLAVEERPEVFYDCAHEERGRVLDWIHAHPAFEDLVTRAVLLAQLKRAA
jgi:hypothetical protein